PGQERLDVPALQLTRMALAVGKDEATDPGHVRLLGAQAVMPEPQPSPHLIQQLRHPPAVAITATAPRYTLTSAVQSHSASMRRRTRPTCPGTPTQTVTQPIGCSYDPPDWLHTAATAILGTTPRPRSRIVVRR